MGHRNWSETEWQLADAHTRARALLARSENGARKALVRLGRSVLKQYSTSFFIVTRFLPPAKRARVDLIYAAVRLPDEIVDTFALSAERKRARLEQWRAQYLLALSLGSMREALLEGVPAILAGFAQVVRETGIPARYYLEFLDAMAADVTPRRYATLDDLIDNYIYGSAIVVGYFLAHVYGATDFERAMLASRELGIALQLTNFVRDVSEDHGRGRLYLPQDMLAHFDGNEQAVVRALARVAQGQYAFAGANLDAFSADCRAAVHACIRVFRELNERVARATSPAQRQSVPMSRKFRALPASKYWRLPLAFMNLEAA